MKLIKDLILFLLCPIFLFSQTDTTITTLTGFEDAAGNTHLFYQTHYSNLGEVIDTSLSNIYHLNTSNLSNSVFLHSETHTQRQTIPPFDTVGKMISELSFFNNDPAQYIYIQKDGISLSANKIIKSGVGIVFSTTERINSLYISKQNQDNVYAVLDSMILKSTDGGNTFPAITDLNNIKIDFTPLVFSPFDENVIFGFNSYNKLVKSYDGGKHSLIVQPDDIWDETSEICFDVNNENIYAATGSNNYFQLMESQNQGNSYTWENIAWYSSRINLKVDTENSGSFFYRKGYDIFHSSNYGLTRDTLFTLGSIPVDFYKTPNQNTYYVAYLNRIEKISDGNSQKLNNFSISNTLSLYPLSIGNKWVYHYTGYYIDVFPIHFDGYKIVKVVADSIINNHLYYNISNNVLNYYWNRIDSISGQIRLLYENSAEDLFFLDLLSPDHSSYEVPYAQVGNVVNTDTTLWGKRRMREHFDFSSLSVITQEYAQGIGLIYETDGFDFGSSTSELQGCVINGIVYGDTTIVVGVSEDDLTLPTEYKLFQNYPNPFNPATTIKYSLPKNAVVKLVIYDLLGREVKTLVNQKQNPGNYEVNFNAENLTSGVYIYRLSVVGKAVNFVQSRKMILLK